MNKILKISFENEMIKGQELYFKNDFINAFHYFERAHILGQRYIIAHTISHFWMLKIGFKTLNIKEIIGQLIRIPAGIIGSAIGVVPIGNTGGSNVSAIKKMDIPADLQEILDHADNTFIK